MLKVDPYTATAGACELFNITARPGQLAALEVLLPLLRPESGPILDIGAGAGANTALVLERLPEARVCALEPSPAMRAIVLSRLASHPEWFDRVTVRPEGFFEAPLPEKMGGAILLAVLGHFNSEERLKLFAELASRLADGAVALIDLQYPERPTRMAEHEFTAAVIGGLEYRGTGEAWPVDEEVMHWKMSYLTLEGERVLSRQETEYDYHHAPPEVVKAEAAQVGLAFERIEQTSFFLLGSDLES